MATTRVHLRLRNKLMWMRKILGPLLIAQALERLAMRADLSRTMERTMWNPQKMMEAKVKSKKSRKPAQRGRKRVSSEMISARTTNAPLAPDSLLMFPTATQLLRKTQWWSFLMMHTLHTRQW